MWSSTTDSYYVIAAASPYVGQINPAGALVKTLTIPSALGGLFDTALNGAVAYSLSQTNIIAVIDLASGDVLQEYSYSTASDRPFWTGMAMWPSNPMLTGAA